MKGIILRHDFAKQFCESISGLIFSCSIDIEWKVLNTCLYLAGLCYFLYDSKDYVTSDEAVAEPACTM